MKRDVAFRFLILMFFTIWPALEAEGVAINASVDRNQITLEDQVVYTLTVEGGDSSASPNLPPLDDFQVRQAGTSTQVSIVNGAMSQSIQFNYILIPKKSGKFVIGPAILNYRGQTLQSRSVELIVHKGGRNNPSGGEGGREDISRYVFAEAFVSKSDPYENEQIVYTFRLYRRIDIANANLEFPAFNGFWTEDLGRQAEFNQNIDGINFHVTEIKKALFPLKAGEMVIEPALLQCEVIVKDNSRRRGSPFDSFFNDPFFNQFTGRQKRVGKNIRSEKLEINVKPLPSQGKPQEFSKLVGNFSISASLEKEEMEVGGSNTVTVIVTGDGNPQDFELQFKVDRENFKVYDDKPELIKDTNRDRVISRKTFKKALVPLKAGDIELPGIELSYFDTNSKEYRTLNAALKTMRVSRRKEAEKLELVGDAQTTPVKKKVEVIGRDIFPIYSDPGDLEKGLSDKVFWSVSTLLFVFPTLLFTVSFIVVKRREKRLSGVEAYRSRTALPQAKKKIKEISHLAESNNTREFFSESSKVFKDYLGAKLNVSGGALTPAEVRELLDKKGVGEGTRGKAVDLLEQCEAGQFALLDNGGKNFDLILNDIHLVMKKLEKEIK